MGKIVTKSVDMNANILYLKHEIVADTSKTQARIEFRNMAYGTITAVKFEAKGYNAFGDVIQIVGKPAFDIVAQDLVIAPKKYAKLDSVLPSKDIRKLDLKLKQVCYANGKIVNVQPEEIVTYEIEEIDENREKLNQQEREARTVLKRRLDEAVCFSKPYGRNWICICGYLNRNTDTICKCCGCREVEMLEEYSEKRVTEKVEEKRRKAAAEQAKREAEQIKFEAEQKRQREEQERREAEERAKAAKRGKIIAGVVGAVTICGVAGYFVNEKVIVPNNKYNHAIESINAGQYEDAIGELKELGEYKDASKKIDEVRKAILEEKYAAACKLLERKAYDKAIRSFNAILEYKDSGDKLLEAKYGKAVNLIEVGEYDSAIEAFKELGDYSDSADQINEATYQKACAYMEREYYSYAKDIFKNLGDYKDCNNKSMECTYNQAQEYIKDGQEDEAISLLKTIVGYKGSKTLLNSLLYKKGLGFFEKKAYKDAIAVFSEIEDYKDSAEMVKKCEKKYDESNILNVYSLINMDENSNSVKEKIGEPDEVNYMWSYRNFESRDCIMYYKEKYQLNGHIGFLQLTFNKIDPSQEFVKDDDGWTLKSCYWYPTKAALNENLYEELKKYVLECWGDPISIDEENKDKKEIVWKNGYALSYLNGSSDVFVSLENKKEVE